MADGTSIISSNLVRGAYKSSQSLQSTVATRDAERTGTGNTFGDMVKEASADAIATIREADAMAQAGLKGDTTTQQVVEATIALESTVKVAVSMRDKFVEAYQEIMRMPI